MSESRTTSALPSTSSTNSSDLPLNERIQSWKAKMKLLEISNSLQCTNCADSYFKNESTTAAPEITSKNDNSVNEIDQSAEDEQKSASSSEVQDFPNGNTNKHEILDRNEKDDKADSKDKDEVVIRVDMPTDNMKAEIVNGAVDEVWITPVDSVQDFDYVVETNEDQCKEKVTNLAKVIDERPVRDPSEIRKNLDDLGLRIGLEGKKSEVLSRSPEHQSDRTLSESPSGATDSWKNATINMNHLPGDNGTQGGATRSVYNTTLRNHQSKIISNNKTLNLGEVIHHHPLFVKNTSKYWYKPTISREEAVNMLRDKPPGTFVVRDSNSFPGAFGLALKVATPPPGVNPGDGTELVRHFLIEPSPKGVKLKGCNDEPVFGTLSALVYQHSITPLALPTKLLLPEYDPATTPEHISAAQLLLQQGAACNVTYVVSLDTESLTGPEAARRCIDQTFELLKQKMIQPVSVHFKVSAQGITITDNTRRLFFRRHYPTQSVTYAGLDPSDRRWDNSYLDDSISKYMKNARMFAFVARKIGSRTENTCHIFAELEPEQPATAVVNFITKVMMGRR